MSRSLSRRGLIKGIGATAAGGYALGSDYGIARRGQALPPLVVGAAVGGVILAGWLRDNNVLSASQPDSGLTASALKQDVFETLRTRKSTNASTIIDNQNIITTGLESSLYVDGKVAAIEALNAEKSEANVETAALNAFKKQAATIETNLLKSYRESVNELINLWNSLKNHSNTSGNALSAYHSSGSGEYQIVGTRTRSVTLTDGTTFDLPEVEYGGTGTYIRSFIDMTVDGRLQYEPESFIYMQDSNWKAVWDDLQAAISNVESGLQTWVSNVYNDVQAGEIDLTDLITPKERAAMLSDEGAAAQAIADLAALNVPIQSGTEMKIKQTSTGATLTGRLALTDDTQTIEVGGTYNPSASTFSGDAYFVYDVAEGTGTWSAYETGIDGGIITLTSEPYDKTSYSFQTSKNETVTVDHGNFTPTDGNGTEVDPQNASAWEADVSDRLENDIANIEAVDYFATSPDSKIEAIKLRNEFVVKEIVDLDTNESKNSADFTSPEPQDDTNYVTQQEWEELQEQNQKLIEQFEQSQESSGSGFDLSGFGFGSLSGTAVAGAAGIGGIAFLAALFK